MLKIQDEAYLAQVREFADRIGQRQQLEDKLQYLGSYACHGGPEETRCELARDFAPYSFHFVMYRKRGDGEYSRWFNGGLIFHGPHDRGGDGGAPTFSVSLAATSKARWEVHT